MSGYFPVDACRDQSPPPPTSYMVSTTANQCRKEYMDNLELPPNNDIASKSNKTIMYHTLLGLPLKCCHNLILNSSLLQNRLPRSDFRITLRRIIISAHSGSCCYYVMVNIYSTPTVRYCLLCSVIRCYN